MPTNKKLHFLSIILVCLIVAGFLSSCSKPTADQPAFPKNEGVDTTVQITGYTEFTGKNHDIFLQKGDKIAVISPSAIPSREQTDAVMKGLTEWGYIPVEGKYTCVNERTLQDCIDDLTWALEDPDIKGIFCVRGGYAATEVMDSITLDIIEKAKKPIIGFSDITVYHSAWINAGVPSIHACMSGTFMDLSDKCVQAQQKIMQGQIPSYKCEANEYCIKGTAKGRLIGGNLSTLLACLGTEYDPTATGEPYILLLEDVGENTSHIHRCLTILKHMGVLDSAQGIIFGEWTDSSMDTSSYDGSSRGGRFTSMSDMISRQLSLDAGIPVAFGFPAGHGDINYPLLMGAETELIVEDEDFFILQK